jgi:hypothetical protein
MTPASSSSRSDCSISPRVTYTYPPGSANALTGHTLTTVKRQSRSARSVFDVSDRPSLVTNCVIAVSATIGT